jgi:hypothetical protein
MDATAPIMPFISVPAAIAMTSLGDMDDVRTYRRKFHYLIKSVYTFFKRRSLCPCEDCHSDFFGGEASFARLKKQSRWNSLPAAATKCLFKRKGHL